MLSDKDIEDLEEKFSDSFIFSKESKFKSSYKDNNYEGKNDSFIFSKESKFKTPYKDNNYENDSLKHFYDLSKIKTQGILKEKNVFKDKGTKKTNNLNLNDYKSDKYIISETPKKTNNLDVNNCEEFQERKKEETFPCRNVNHHKNTAFENQNSLSNTNTPNVSKSMKESLREDFSEPFTYKNWQPNNKSTTTETLTNKYSNRESFNSKNNMIDSKNMESSTNKHSNRESFNSKNNIIDSKNTENLTKLQHELDNLKDTHKRMLQIKSKLLYLIDIEVQKVKKSIIHEKNEEIKKIIYKYKTTILEKDSIIDNLKTQLEYKTRGSNTENNSKNIVNHLEMYKRKVEKYKEAYIKLKEKYRKDILNRML